MPGIFSYHLVDVVCILGVVLGIRLMQSPRTARTGNLLGAISMLMAIITTLVSGKIISLNLLWGSLVVGSAVGVWLAMYVTMNRMPQLVGLLNGLGGASSAAVAFLEFSGNTDADARIKLLTIALALVIGSITFGGSVIAVAKLDGKINQRPVVLRNHFMWSFLSLLATAVLIPLVVFGSSATAMLFIVLLLATSLIFSVLFSIRVGGADMPITICLLNSLSGIAAAAVGLATANLFVIAVGAMVGSSGIVLTRIMCRAMNSSIYQILMGKTVMSPPPSAAGASKQDSSAAIPAVVPMAAPAAEDIAVALDKAAAVLAAAHTIIVVPGYGMALAQAQAQVKQLMDLLEAQGKQVKFAIHPVAGRMPGHMNVLLAEVDVPYDKLQPMEEINPEFRQTDVALVVGANDVINPAARTAEGTPIYGMPVLNVDEAGHVIICNKDTRPGYAGVNNPLYTSRPNTITLFQDAVETLSILVEKLRKE